MDPSVAESFNVITQIVERQVRCTGPERDGLRQHLLNIRQALEGCPAQLAANAAPAAAEEPQSQ